MTNLVGQRLVDIAAAVEHRNCQGEVWLSETESDEVVCRSGRLERRGSALRRLLAVTVWRDMHEGTATGDLTDSPEDLVDAAISVGAATPPRAPLPAPEPPADVDVAAAWPTLSDADVDRLTSLSVSDEEQDVELRLRVERRRVGIIRAGGGPQQYTTGFAKLRMRIPSRRGSGRGFAVEELYGREVSPVLGRAAGGVLDEARAISRLLADPSQDRGRHDAVLLDGGVVTELMYALAGAFQLDNVRNGLSDLDGRVGEQVAGPGVGLLDDLNDPCSPMPVPWDDEGTPLRRTELLRDGVLGGFLADRRTALGASLTGGSGAGWRGPDGGTPEVRPGCLILMPGALVERADLAPTVMKIVQCNGSLNVSELTGDFTVGADAVLLGPSGPPRNAGRVTVSGNLFVILQALHGHDGQLYVRQWDETFYASPGIYVDKVTIRR